MATFTKVTGGSTHEPSFVVEVQPKRQVRNIERDLLHSSTSRGSFVPTSNRSGTFTLRYASHSAALTGAAYFAAGTLFLYDGPDSSFDVRFMVTGDLEPERNSEDPDQWDLKFAFKEFPA